MEILFFIIAIIVFSVVVHEVSHGVVANSLGDPTAKNAGRLTLNPIPHIDPIGSIILPGILILLGGVVIAWAKPVPVNPFNFRDQKFGSLKVSFAGPLSNLALALMFGLALRFLPIYAVSETLGLFFGLIVYFNLLLAVFNLLPIPPLDGSHILFTFFPNMLKYLQGVFSMYGIFLILLFLFLFGRFLYQAIVWLFLFIVGDIALLVDILRVLNS